MDEDERLAALARLREPFPAHQVLKLPKPTRKENPKGKCNECGGYHGLPANHLDYVGHAAITDRLLDVDPCWACRIISVDETGSPKLDKYDGLWIELTVLGVSRMGYGFPTSRDGGDGIKEAYGDALRNAGMRFGMGLELWHKGDLHGSGNLDPALVDDEIPSEDIDGRSPRTEPRPKPTPLPVPPADTSPLPGKREAQWGKGKNISEARGKALFGLASGTAKELGLTWEDAKVAVKTVLEARGVEHVDLIQFPDIDEIRAEVALELRAMHEGKSHES